MGETDRADRSSKQTGEYECVEKHASHTLPVAHEPEGGVKGGFLIPTRGFFRVQGVFELKNLMIMALMVSLAAILGHFTLYITPTFKGISFAYLPGAMVAALFGPWAALAFGLVSDTVVFLINPQGGYFPGYAISEMAAYFIYALFLYRRPVTYLRALLARAVVLIVVVFGLNYQWNSIMFGTAAAGYFTGARMINNLVQWPIHAMLIAYMSKLAIRVYERGIGGVRVLHGMNTVPQSVHGDAPLGAEVPAPACQTDEP